MAEELIETHYEDLAALVEKILDETDAQIQIQATKAGVWVRLVSTDEHSQLGNWACLVVWDVEFLRLLGAAFNLLQLSRNVINRNRHFSPLSQQ